MLALAQAQWWSVSVALAGTRQRLSSVQFEPTSTEPALVVATFNVTYHVSKTEDANAWIADIVSQLDDVTTGGMATGNVFSATEVQQLGLYSIGKVLTATCSSIVCTSAAAVASGAGALLAAVALAALLL